MRLTTKEQGRQWILASDGNVIAGAHHTIAMRVENAPARRSTTFKCYWLVVLRHTRVRVRVHLVWMVWRFYADGVVSSIWMACMRERRGTVKTSVQLELEDEEY